MPNEMTAGEAAEKLESLADDANSIEPEKYGRAKLVDVTFHVPGDINVLRYAASVLRRVASGELAEVVHAHWIPNKDGWQHCSNCSEYALEDSNGFPVESNRCPSCGADMRQTQDGKDDSHE